MADDRLFHKRLGHSEKVNLLTADEEIVWRTYVQEADDFGVMLFSAFEIQRGHDRFRKMATRVVQRMLERVRDVGLVSTFEHQAREYCFQIDWQTYQKVRYPLETINPRIPADLLAACDLPTQWLHTVWPGAVGRNRKLKNWRPPEEWQAPNWADGSGNGSRTGSRTVPGTFQDGSSLRATRARAGRAIGEREGAGVSLKGGVGENIARLEDDLPERERRAGQFVERYRELFERFRHGAKYVSRPALDYHEALLLVDVWDDARLDRLVEAFLTTDNEFCRNGNGTIAQFRSRASWCDSKLREAGL